MGVDDGRDRVGRVVEAVDEFETQRDQKGEAEQRENAERQGLVYALDVVEKPVYAVADAGCQEHQEYCRRQKARLGVERRSDGRSSYGDIGHTDIPPTFTRWDLAMAAAMLVRRFCDGSMTAEDLKAYQTPKLPGKGRFFGKVRALTRPLPAPKSRSPRALRETTRNFMSNSAHERIRTDIAENDVVLFMKGTPVFPQCGFSAAVVQILSDLGVKFKGVERAGRSGDPPGHQGILELADDPAALCEGRIRRRRDIIREMFEAGELWPLLRRKAASSLEKV